MSRVLTYLGRFFVIIVGYAAAALAASAMLHVLFLGSLGWTAAEAGHVATGSLIFSIPFVALFVAYFGFAPSVPAILLGELTGSRGWLFYAIAGGLVGTVVALFFNVSVGSDVASGGSGGSPDDAVSDARFLAMMVACGMSGGIAYWLVAGRTAGNWRR